MKKRGLLLCSMMLLFVLTGCGNAEKAKNKGTDINKIDTVMGEIEVPQKPERVVVNWYIGDAFSLDLNVVGYSAGHRRPCHFMISFQHLQNWKIGLQRILWR